MSNQPPQRAILYYPTSIIPESGWLRQALLYWDQVATIMPAGTTYDVLTKYIIPSAYAKSNRPYIDCHMDSPRGRKAISVMIDLENEGELIRVEPEALDLNNKHADEELGQEFATVIRSKSFRALAGIPSRPLKLFGIGSASPKNWMKGFNQLNLEFPFMLHVSKMSASNIELMEAEGFAQQHDEWLLCEPHAAIVYTSLFAKYLAEAFTKRQDILMCPGTDQQLYQTLAFGGEPNAEKAISLATNLVNALPVPREDVDLITLIRFKQKRRDELLQFRTIMDEFQSQLADCAEPMGMDIPHSC